MQYINYLLFRLLAGFIGILPFPVMYKLSDVLAWFLRKVFRYRTDVTKQNLENSFPDKSETELNSIFKKSYINLADVLLEGIKGFSMSEEEIKRRYVFHDTELVHSYYDQGKHVILYASHYANWEWGPLAVGHFIKHRSLGIVKLLKNKYINDYVQTHRCGKNVFWADVAKAGTAIRSFADQPTQFVFLSDQGPSNTKTAHWIRFLNQDTPCHFGVDRLARRRGYPVFNIITKRVKRGHYKLRYELLTDDPSKTTDGEITELYMRSLERQIIEKPEYWLWSHKRWKRANERLDF